MGKALATRLIEKGWRAALFDINQEAGSELGMFHLASLA
jgi:3-hydroxyisobutyrate dehydrogenase-like beta-hydroxyacid dehydrogenase